MEQRTLGEKVSDAIAEFGGSWKFIFIFATFLAAWLVINTLAVFDVIAFDKAPFILLNLILSFIAAFQAPFIMMSQNRQGKKQDESYRSMLTEIRTLVENDLAIDSMDKEAIDEIRAMLQKLLDQASK